MSIMQSGADYVAEWITSHRKQLGGTNHTSKWREKYSRAFCAEFETPTHVIQVCAWDNAYCLDIPALNKATGSDDYIVVGDCGGVAGLSARLNTFPIWLDTKKPADHA
jgi:hypothetical protein